LVRVSALAVLLALTLGACTVASPRAVLRPPSLPEMPDLSPGGIAGPEPTYYRGTIAITIKSILGDPERASPLRISEPRRFLSLKGPSWLVCLKTNHFPIPRHYAVVFQQNRIVESRLSVVLDHCELQFYTAFDWAMETTPQPTL
jgi:hypothetical protein